MRSAFWNGSLWMGQPWSGTLPTELIALREAVEADTVQLI